MHCSSTIYLFIRRRRARPRITILTQSFVHRTHVLIFDTYYPTFFKNWFSDQWITSIYGKDNTLIMTDFLVDNANSQGTRYVPSVVSSKQLSSLVTDAKERIENWIYSTEQKRQTQQTEERRRK